MRVQEEGRGIEGGQAAGAGGAKMHHMLCFGSRVMLKMQKVGQVCKMRWEMNIALSIYLSQVCQVAKQQEQE